MCGYYFFYELYGDTIFNTEEFKNIFFIFNGNHQQCNWTFHKNVIFKNTSTFTLQEKDEVPEGKYLKQL